MIQINFGVCNVKNSPKRSWFFTLRFGESSLCCLVTSFQNQIKIALKLKSNKHRESTSSKQLIKRDPPS